ncbi:MAG: MazG-like family protein [Erysipelotrichaceae bacterium]
MEELLRKITKMRVDKGWDKSDTPEILAKSVFAEAGELLECYLVEHPDLESVKSELADVLMYTLSLCVDLGLDPTEVVESKFIDIDRRYPSK